MLDNKCWDYPGFQWRPQSVWAVPVWVTATIMPHWWGVYFKIKRFVFPSVTRKSPKPIFGSMFAAQRKRRLYKRTQRLYHIVRIRTLTSATKYNIWVHVYITESTLQLLWIDRTNTNRFFAAAALSLCRRFLNQLPTWVGVRPVAWASSRFFVGFGYGSWRYHSLSRLRVRSLKQCVFCSPSQMVRGSGNFFRTRYLSTGPRGLPRSLSASW